MNFNKKQVFLIVFLLVVSNIITFKLTYDFVNMKTFLLYTELDAYKIKAYDQNNTKYMDVTINGGIDSVFYDIGNTGDTDKYKSLCRVFDKELFEVVEKYHRINRERYGDYTDPELQQIKANIENGIINMKKLCNVKD